MKNIIRHSALVLGLSTIFAQSAFALPSLGNLGNAIKGKVIKVAVDAGIDAANEKVKDGIREAACMASYSACVGAAMTLFTTDQAAGSAALLCCDTGFAACMQFPGSGGSNIEVNPEDSASLGGAEEDF